jgi:hypothetical protein
MKLSQAINLLENYIQQAPEYFIRITTHELLTKPAPDKWSKQEILGHLTDSALNNLKRFTESQFLPQPYQVIRYQQDEVVAANGYQRLTLEHILTLWKALNRQIVYVMKNIPEDKLHYTIITPSGESKTLEWLMIDYVEHMQHHWRQVGFIY